MKDVKFTPTAYQEYLNWLKKDKSMFKHLSELIVETARNPFEGRGKPEPLKGNFSGCWSRRIDQKNRMVYRVEAGQITILGCEGHYDD